MEAIRLSLASEEERCRREEKEARKDAKKREKEVKKADKAARKTGLYSGNASSTALGVPGESASVSKATSSSSSVTGEEASSVTGKGKAVDRATAATALDTTGSASTSSASPDLVIPPIDPPATAEPSRSSHLRHVSSASSSFSSILETNSEERVGNHASTDAGNPSLEPMLNFRSLAAVIGDEDKGHDSQHVEDASAQPAGSSSATPSVSQPPGDTPRTETDPVNAENKELAATQQDRDVNLQLPKELETRSVEITTSNPQASS